MKRTEFKARFFDGKTYRERRVYADETGAWRVKISGIFFPVNSVMMNMKIYKEE